MELQRRKWVPDVNEVADQLVHDYFTADDEYEGRLDADSTLGTWINETAAFHGGEWTEGDWYALVHALLRRMVNLKLYGTTDEPDTPEDYGLSPRGEDYGKPEEDQP